MSHKMKISTFLLILVFLFVSSLVFTDPQLFGVCHDSDCLNKYGAEYGQAIGLLSFVAILLSFVFFFTPKLVFQTWKKFAIIYLPLALIWIFFTPTSAGFLQADREIVTWWTAGGFLVISLIIIAWKSWRLRKEKH